MKIRFSLGLAATAFLVAGATSPARACESSKGVTARGLFRRAANKKRTPLTSFLAGTKTRLDGAAADPGAEPSIAGLWSTAIVDGDQVEDAGFEMFNVGGTHLLNDPSPILEGNVCLGAWTQVAPRTYLTNHPSYAYDDQGVNVVGMATIYEKVVLDPGGDSFNETFRVVVTDSDGKVLQTIDGAAVGKRVKGDDNPLKDTNPSQ